jgi:hypothetical protein
MDVKQSLSVVRGVHITVVQEPGVLCVHVLSGGAVFIILHYSE